MQIPSETERTISLTAIAEQIHSSPETVLRFLELKGIQPYVKVPYSRGYMRLYKPNEVPIEGIKKYAAEAQEVAKEKRLAVMKDPATRVKAIEARKANAVKRGKDASGAELELRLQEAQKAVKALSKIVKKYRTE